MVIVKFQDPSRSISFFSILKDYLKPTGELIYVTVSVAPVDRGVDGEAEFRVLSLLFKKKLTLSNLVGDALSIIIKQRWRSFEETLLKSPYDTLAVRIGNFVDKNLGINYPNAVVLTGRTKPPIYLKTSKFLLKLINVNEELARLIIDALNRLPHL